MRRQPPRMQSHSVGVLESCVRTLLDPGFLRFVDEELLQFLLVFVGQFGEVDVLAEGLRVHRGGEGDGVWVLIVCVWLTGLGIKISSGCLDVQASSASRDGRPLAYFALCESVSCLQVISILLILVNTVMESRGKLGVVLLYIHYNCGSFVEWRPVQRATSIYINKKLATTQWEIANVKQ